MLLANRAVLTVADDRKLVAGDAHLDQIVLGGLRPGIAERQVVFGRATLVAVTLDGQLVIRKILQDVAELRGVGLERVDRIGAQGVLVVVEVSVFNPGQKLVDTTV